MAEIVLTERKVNVANIEAVEWDAVGLGRMAVGVTGLTILLCLSELCDDGNTEELLASKLNSPVDSFFLLELNIADTVYKVSIASFK